MSNNPLVSIVVRTKDRPKLLKRALQSIAEQTYRPMEVVLVNDGGCDLNINELTGILKDVALNAFSFSNLHRRPSMSGLPMLMI
ncbi:MAG: glycosyltransferase [Thermodesulfovibrionales bacterium]